MIERPTIMEQIIPRIGAGTVKILAGPRRAGKSTMLKLIVRHLITQGEPRAAMMHLDLESATHLGIHGPSDLISHVRKAFGPAGATDTVHLFLDDIQFLDGWEQAVGTLLDEFDADIYLTTSNARTLRMAEGSSMAGRWALIDVHPLSFAEFLGAYQDICETGESGPIDRHTALRAYATQGGFPFQTDLAFDGRSTIQYVDDLTGSILFKDVMLPNAIRDASALERTIRFVAANEGTVLTIADIVAHLRETDRGRRTGRISSETVSGYLNAAADAFLIARVPQEDVLSGRTFKIGERIYLADPGIRQAFGLSNLEADAAPRVMRGIVANELLRRGFTVRTGKPAAPCGRSIDFIARRRGSTEYLQIVPSTLSRTDVDAALAAFDGIRDNWPKTVLGMDGAPADHDGIHGMDVTDWLLCADMQ